MAELPYPHERPGERTSTDRFIASLLHGPRALLVRGEPGIGRTVVWWRVVERCRRERFSVLVARAADEERELALGGLVDLLDGLPAPSLVLDEQTAPPERGRALLETLQRRCAETPTVVAIDDLQWLDAVSARTLRFALRHVQAERLGVVATVLAGADDDPLGLAASLPAGSVETLELHPLGLDALRHVLAGTVPSVSSPLLARIHRTSAGNPLHACLLARSLTAEERTSASEALPLPRSLRGAVLRRLETVPEQVVPLLETVAAATRIPLSALRELHGAGVDELVERAARDGVLDDEGGTVRFAHPLLQAAVHLELSPARRRQLHRMLAARARDAIVRATHLSLSLERPDAEAARELEEAARAAGQRGMLATAARLAQASRRLTPPADAEAAHRRAIGEIGHLAAAGEVRKARLLADRLVARVPPGPRRAEAFVARYYVEDGDAAVAEADLREALVQAGRDDALRTRILTELSQLQGWYLGALPAAIDAGREALASARRLGDLDLEMAVLGDLSHLEAAAGTPRPDRLERAVALETRRGRPPVWNGPALWIGPRALRAKQLYWAGDLRAARAQLAALLAEAIRTGSSYQRHYLLYDLALVECAAGRLATAGAHVQRAIESARDAEDPEGEWSLLYPLALVETWLGHAGAARDAAQQRLRSARERGERTGIARARWVLGLLLLSEGEAGAAARELAESARLVEDMGYGNPGAFPVLLDAIEAHAANGEREEAERLLERLERRLPGLDSRWANAAAARCRGVVMMVAGDEDAPLVLRDAAVRLARLGHQGEAARALLTCGRALRRAGRRSDAVEVLERSQRRFERLGAALWAARARVELQRALQAPAVSVLTTTEQEIVALVAQGMRNREVAQSLLLRVATVEGHLTRIYRKLGVRSRGELVRVLTEQADEQAEAP